MKLSVLIAELQKHFNEYGDVECYCNGEHGIENPYILQSDMISVGSLNVILDPDDFKDVDDSDIICHIGRNYSTHQWVSTI